VRRVLSFHYLAFFSAMAAYFPYAPGWFRERGLSGLQIGLLVALMPAMSVLSPPLMGMLADALGLRGTIMRVASLGAVVAMGSLALLSLGAAPVSFSALFVAVFAFNLFRSPLSQLADVAALEYPGDYGRLRVWGSIGFMIAAPAFGRWVPLNPAWCIPTACAVGLACAIVTSFLLPKRAAPPRSGITGEARALLRNRSFLLLVATAGLGQAAHAAYDLCISMHLSDLGASGTVVGVAWALATAGEIVLMSVSAWLFAKRPASMWFVLSLAVGIGRWLLFAWVDDPNVLLLAQPLHGLTFGVRWVSSLTLLRQFAGEGTMGTAQGLFMAVFSLGGVVGMLGWGPLFEHFGGSTVFAAAAAVGAGASGVSVRLHFDLARRERDAALSAAGAA